MEKRSGQSGAKARKKSLEKTDPRQEQFNKLFSMPVVVSWSDGHTSESQLILMFYSDEDYKRYKAYKDSGKAYPVKVEAIELSEAEKAEQSKVFSTGHNRGEELEILRTMCKDFTEALQRYLADQDPLQLADEATEIINRQAEEASQAMSKDIPDLEGVEL